MKNFKYIVIFFIFFLLTCVKERPRDIFRKINNAIKKNDINALKNCYTEETQILFSKLDETQGSQIPWYEQIIQAGVQEEPKVIKEKIEKNRAFLTIEHQNRQANISLIKVGNEWKLDLTKELTFILNIIEQQKMMEEREKIERK